MHLPESPPESPAGPPSAAHVPESRHAIALRRTDDVVDAFAAVTRERGAVDARELRVLARAGELIGVPGGDAADAADAGDPIPDVGRDIARRSLIAELATTTRMSEWTITRLLNQAIDVCGRFGVAVDAVERGELSRVHLLTIYEAAAGIDDEENLAQYLSRAMERARVLTPGRLRPVVNTIAERYRDRSLAERATMAAQARRVGVRDLADGLAELFAVLPATLAHAIHDRLTQQARTIVSDRDAGGDASEDAAGERAADAAEGSDAVEGCGAAETCETVKGSDTVEESDAIERVDPLGAPDTVKGTNPIEETDPAESPDAFEGVSAIAVDAVAGAARDSRTLDQIRADVLTDLLLTGTPDTCLGDGLGEIRGHVSVTVPVLTVTGNSTEPCTLAGYGPIDPATAARLAGAASGWDRVMTSPIDGAVLATDRYRPPEALRRFLRARDEHCRFPGCRRNAVRCDVDHTVDAALGGPTSPGNTAHLCRRHHTLKHHSAWTVRQKSPGELVWTSPSGHAHTDRPEPVVRFVPEHEAPPAPGRQRWAWRPDAPPVTDAPF
ncbi:HNH endonuclease signature motif containing protein [Microbacterium sp. No. 7]|uniref:HNH endonuclease signature motif containing protein n=1 Tax=Microbacterium sp. No. 7 TaxID=1714373 RepID=UPI0006D26053|nr:HNH endonuclease signature motif containing protein [Microbacterium sp. No. 7]